MEERKKKMLFKCQSKLARRQLKGKKEYIKSEFTNDEMLEYVQRLYMHEGVASIVENIEEPHDTCIDIEDINKGSENIATSELFKWTIPYTCH